MAVIHEISKAFSQQAGIYDEVATVQHEIGLRLLDRLQYLKINPKTILDLGCGPGRFSRELSLLYPKAQIVGMDLAPSMLVAARKKQRWRCKWSLVAADMKHMPFPSGVFDLVFANQVIHWSDSFAMVVREINRIMNRNGCFMFTTLGPDTFREIKASWAAVNDYAHVNSFLDMHDIGDLLLQEYFVDPVMDLDWLEVHYKSVTDLVKALKNQGVRNVSPQRNRGLTGKESWRLFRHYYEQFLSSEGKYPLTYEVLYGHSWKGSHHQTNQGVDSFIPISSIKKR